MNQRLPVINQFCSAVEKKQDVWELGYPAFAVFALIPIEKSNKAQSAFNKGSEDGQKL